MIRRSITLCIPIYSQHFSFYLGDGWKQTDTYKLASNIPQNQKPNEKLYETKFHWRGRLVKFLSNEPQELKPNEDVNEPQDQKPNGKYTPEELQKMPFTTYVTKCLFRSPLDLVVGMIWIPVALTFYYCTVMFSWCFVIYVLTQPKKINHMMMRLE